MAETSLEEGPGTGDRTRRREGTGDRTRRTDGTGDGDRRTGAGDHDRRGPGIGGCGGEGRLETVTEGRIVGGPTGEDETI